ncbi:disease resistance protein At4g27190 [Eucalyptus grandis]|uniref:disease resistance protein At4g27190 n=1 Tax=Eucalyptus grandis TaxID=71139 RepID=UPI00192EFBDF|nr:disease resistance protein At4g27190 [Eucalyptus grandis]XP_039172536.1 disease resistance protein At4g27190 [Eucalyptus grandis]XP_039172537.1 disease resistance protein At4g27190 [Eucalyptus grandis]
MSIDPAITIAWDVLKCVVAPIKRQFGYVMSSKSYARDLQKQVGKLAYEAERVHNAVEVARSNLRNVYSQVMEWQACAEKSLKDAQDLLGVIEKASKTCCYGTIPDPSSRYQFSRKAKEKIEIIRQLAREGSEFKDISFSDPAPGNVVAPTLAGGAGKDVVQLTAAMASTSSASMLIKLKDDGVFESRASMIRKIMDALADNCYSVVGVHGMGGVGKSTLLVDAERCIREEKSFDLVAKADVSENPDIKRIQEEIAHALGLSDVKNEEYVSLRANLLHRRLEDEERKKKKVLIILDNLWEGLDLKSVGIPCRHDNRVLGCKLLLTSRDRDVLRREMACDRDFLLGGLKEEEARRLFERMVGDKVHDDVFKPLVDEALHKCAGLPFLILAMAKRFKDADIFEWSDTLKQIEMCKNEGIGEVINKMLQLSYDHLKGDEVKSLLQLCVVYGISKPSLNNLVRYAIGLGLFGEYNRLEDARNRLRSLIRTLQASSLLLDNGDADSFKIHDLVRQFVSSVASRDHPLLVLKDKHKSVTKLSKDTLKSCKAICFPYVDMKELPQELDCPELHIFLLFTNNKSLNVPNSYFDSMRKVMVLNLTGIRLTLSPSLFQFLENLHTLCLDGCLLEDVAILGKLKGLEILSFVNSKIQRLPKEMGQLAKLRLLDLNCSLLEIIEPDVLGSLIKLEELYMENSFHQWNAMEQTPPTNASLIELNNMTNLYTLHVSIPDPSVLPEDLNLEKLTRYRIQIGNAWRWPSENKGSRTLELKLNPVSEVLRKGCIQSILGKTNNLFLDGLNGIEQSICRLSLKCFPKLKHLHIQNSSSVHYILGWPCIPTFKTLESLHLQNLINLEKLCHNYISSKSFSTLKVVRVINCDKMEVLFPLSSMSELPQLEEISVFECYLMREIVEADKCGKIELRNLHELKLRDLPNIKNFSIAKIAPSNSTSDDQVGTRVAFFNGQQVTFPCLENLDISGMDNIEMIWDNQVTEDSFHDLESLSVHECSKLKCVWDKKLYCQDKFQCLRSVSISRCESLTSLFPTSVAKDLIHLEELKIDKSGIVKLIEKEGSEELTINVEAVQGPSHNLKVILPISKYFGHLKTLDVSYCDGLSNMFPPIIAENLVELTKLRISNCKMLTEVISDEGGKEGHVVAFNQLKYMELNGLIGLRCFSSAKYTLMFPLLEDVIVIGCFNMKFFSRDQ